MVIIKSEKIIELYYSDVIFNIHKTLYKLSVFKEKYKSDFTDFEKKYNNSKYQNSDIDEDYLNWKNCINTYNNLNTQKKHIQKGNYKIII